MAATLVLGDSAKTLVANALKDDLVHVFVGVFNDGSSLGATLTNTDIQTNSSDGSSRVKQPRLNAIGTEYRTYNDLVLTDESRITNFYIRDGIEVNKLVLMSSANVVNGIITFPTITPTETKSLYVPQIRITVL